MTFRPCVSLIWIARNLDASWFFYKQFFAKGFVVEFLIFQTLKFFNLLLQIGFGSVVDIELKVV
jgi:hypothetical protein